MNSKTSSVYSSENTTISTLDDQNLWLKPGVQLTPIVINGEFCEKNPYLKNGSNLGISYSRESRLEQEHVKIVKYENYFHRTLQKVDELRIGMNLDNNLEDIIFNNLSIFKTLNEYFLKQLRLSLNYVNFEKLVKLHLNKFFKYFQSFVQNYKYLVFGMKKLKGIYGKKLKGVDLNDDLFQYPFSYVVYYQGINFELNLGLHWEFELPRGPKNDLDSLVSNFKIKYKLLFQLQRRFLQSPFQLLTEDLTRLSFRFRSIDECVIDENFRATPSTEKFLNSSNRSIHELFELKLDFAQKVLSEEWLKLCDLINHLIRELGNVEVAVIQYEKFVNVNNRYIIENFRDWTRLEMELDWRLPMIEKVVKCFITGLHQIFILTCIKIAQSLSGESNDTSLDIVSDYQKQMTFKKSSLLLLSLNGEKVLKYYFNSLNPDVVPLSPGSSVTIRKFFI